MWYDSSVNSFSFVMKDSPLKIAWIEADQPNERNTSLHRIENPATMMAEAGHECFVSHYNLLFPTIYHPLNEKFLSGVRETFERLKWADVVVIERLITKPTHNIIRWLREMGKKVYCSFDDAYHLMPSGAGSPFQTWRGGNDALGGRGDILGEFREGLRLCTGAVVPSKVLQQDYRQFNANIQYVPNFLYPPLWDDLPAKDLDNIVILWGGSSGHFLSWRESGLIPALGQLCRKYPKLYIHLQSRDPRITGLFDKFAVKYTAHNWVKFSDWSKIVATATIGVAPLSGAYDSRRSSLKAQEFGMAGVPWIATKDAPYLESKGGILVNNKTSEWIRAIESLIKDKALYARLSEEGRAWATEFNLQCAPTYEKVFGL